jgi:Zn-finger nucleic acid-binding protein
MLCPIDESSLEDRQCGTAQYAICPLCHGVWVSAATVKTLLRGDVVLSREVLQAATPVRSHVAIEAFQDAVAAVTGKRDVRRTLPRRYHCVDCGAMLRMTDPLTTASPCTRCGAVWIQRGEEAGIGAWYRHAVQAGAMALLESSSTTIARARADDENVSWRKMIIVIGGSFAAFVLFAPGANGASPYVRHLPGIALGGGGAMLVVVGLKHPSRYEIGALTPKGLAFALTGVGLILAAIFAWR